MKSPPTGWRARASRNVSTWPGAAHDGAYVAPGGGRPVHVPTAAPADAGIAARRCQTGITIPFGRSKVFVPPDESRVPAGGAGELLGIDVVGGDGQLAGVIEQVVEQDLRGKHRQERQEQRRSRGAEHVLEIAGGAHQYVLHRVGEDPAPF